MTRFVVALLFIALLVAIGPAAPLPKDAKEPVHYFPTKVGTKWVYEDGPENWTEVITRVERKGAATVITVNCEGGGKPAQGSRMAVSEAGLFLTAIEDDCEIDPPACLLKLPAKPGVEWDFVVATLVNNTGTAKVVGVEKVEVPAGVFTAVRVEKSLMLGKRPMNLTNWYSPGVGLVKSVSGDNVKVLKSFALGKD